MDVFAAVVMLLGARAHRRTARGADDRVGVERKHLLASTFFSLMDRMGVKLDSFGDATTRLEGL